MAKERTNNSEALVGRAVNLIFIKLEREQRAFLLETFDHYNNLPKGTSKERTIARNFVTKTAEELLQNPQDISLADKTWRRHEEGRNGLQESEASFSECVRKERLVLIKEKWDDVIPGQLAKLVRIYASKDPSKDTAKDLLTNYFKGPKSRNQRIDAYYNFVSGVLDLAEEKEAFIEGMKIALHATDILPKNPSLVEQTGSLSLPYGEVESVFKKLLIARSVIARVRFMGSWDIDKYYEDRGNFIITDSVAIEGGDKRKGNVIGKIGENETRKMYERMKATMRFIASGSIESLSEERRQILKDTWPFNLVLDETDHLNQKFKRVFSDQSSHSSQVSS